jgi:hypothetical protein
VGGVEIHMLIDSGSTCNVMWNYGKKWKYKKYDVVQEKAVWQKSACVQSEPLDIIGVGKTYVETAPKVNNVTNVKFYVIHGKGVPLLGKKPLPL